MSLVREGMEPADEVVATLFAAHATELTRVAYLVVGDRWVAEEIVQEAFLRVWRSRRRLRDVDAAPAYLRRAVVNLARSRVRRLVLERRHARADRDAAPESASWVDLRRAVAALPPRRRACVVLRYFADLSEAETAQTLGVSVGTVKSQTSKALRQLQGVLGDREESLR
ncbi:MAG TPA: SigE family RNA polymerase sigma factor [Frankiaceae bacterium]|nr:SigE family RNA polymerase sigma factor [Frankiaceae bacterium]